MMKQKKIPMRTCVATREKCEKKGFNKSCKR